MTTPPKCSKIGCNKKLKPKRDSKRYCSVACKQAAYRERKGQSTKGPVTKEGI